MRRVKRTGAFETNSSSVHTLVISRDGLEPSNLPMENGYILADFGQFGKDEMTFSSQADKLSYLLTECYYLNRYDEDIKDYYVFKEIEEAICEYTGAKGIKILNKQEPEIDHQEIPEYGELHFCNAYDHQSVINFVFNRYIALHTDCD